MKQSGCRLLAVSAVLLLAGCGSYEDRVMATCERLGMGRGSIDYADCVHEQHAIDTYDRARWTGVMLGGMRMATPPPSTTTTIWVHH